MRLVESELNNEWRRIRCGPMNGKNDSLGICVTIWWLWRRSCSASFPPVNFNPTRRLSNFLLLLYTLNYNYYYSLFANIKYLFTVSSSHSISLLPYTFLPLSLKHGLTAPNRRPKPPPLLPTPSLLLACSKLFNWFLLRRIRGKKTDHTCLSILCQREQGRSKRREREIDRYRRKKTLTT